MMPWSRRSSRLRGWPIATIAFYGPNLSQATKITVGIVPSENAEVEELRDWKVNRGDIPGGLPGALSILQRMKVAAPEVEAKHDVRPQLRIGLNTGAAVVGKVQGGADAQVTVLGDTVNFASRLQSLAEQAVAAKHRWRTN